jgi:hypothetical protein
MQFQGRNKCTVIVKKPGSIPVEKNFIYESHKRPRPIMNENQMKEIKSLLFSSLVLGTWLKVTSLNNGDISKQLCQVRSINDSSKTMIVQDEYDALYTMNLNNITNIIEMNP